LALHISLLGRIPISSPKSVIIRKKKNGGKALTNEKNFDMEFFVTAAEAADIITEPNFCKRPTGIVPPFLIAGVT
jgi:hypothetical protein